MHAPDRLRFIELGWSIPGTGSMYCGYMTLLFIQRDTVPATEITRQRKMNDRPDDWVSPNARVNEFWSSAAHSASNVYTPPVTTAARGSSTSSTRCSEILDIATVPDYRVTQIYLIFISVSVVGRKWENALWWVWEEIISRENTSFFG